MPSNDSPPRVALQPWPESRKRSTSASGRPPRYVGWVPRLELRLSEEPERFKRNVTALRGILCSAPVGQVPEAIPLETGSRYRRPSVQDTIAQSLGH